MQIKDVVMPKWFLDTKRGIGMVMAAMPPLVGFVGAYFGVTVDVATVGTLVTGVVDWVGFGIQVVGYGLWAYGSMYPTAPLTLMRP